MEQKKLKREVVKQRFVRSLGCNLILFPVTILILTILVFFWLFCLKLYVTALQLEPFDGRSYLVALLLFVTTGIFAIAHALWNDAKLFYQTFSRYKQMRQETSRIESLIPQSKYESTTEIHNLEYFEEAESTNKINEVIRYGKR